jgi:hypothetical protein
MGKMKVRSKTDQNLTKHYNYDDGDDCDADSCNSKVDAAYLPYVFLRNIISMRDFSLPSRTG